MIELKVLYYNALEKKGYDLYLNYTRYTR